MTSLYLRYRPTSYSEIVGQDQAVSLLKAKSAVQHIILLTGSSGTGKTTLARIAAKEVGCTTIHEKDCADDRSIDMVRDLKESMRYHALTGGSQAWIMDEATQLPKTTQQAMLTAMEECPEWIWLFFCTTDTTGLLPTFLGRCFQVNLYDLGPRELEKIVARALIGEKKKLPMPVMTSINKKSFGSARMALQLAEAALAFDGDEAKQLQIINSSSTVDDDKVEFLARLLIKRSAWTEVAKSLSGVTEQDVFGLRKQVSTYMAKVLLGGNNDMAVIVLEKFSEVTDLPSLILACWKIVNRR